MHMIKQRMAVAAEYIRHTLATHAQLDAGSSEVPWHALTKSMLLCFEPERQEEGEGKVPQEGVK